jgi:hypothetical protein
VVEVVTEGLLAEGVVVVCEQDELVPRDVDRARGHAEHLAVGVQAGEEPGAEALDHRRQLAVAQLRVTLRDLVGQRRRKGVALDVGSPPPELPLPSTPPAQKSETYAVDCRFEPREP